MILECHRSACFGILLLARGLNDVKQCDRTDIVSIITILFRH